MTARVTALRASPVKGFPQDSVETLELRPEGIAEDRRFVVFQPDTKALYGAELTALAGARARWDEASRSLTLRFSGGEEVTAVVDEGDELTAYGYGRRAIAGRVVDGPLAEAISEQVGRPLRLLAVAPGVGAIKAATIVSEASIRRVADELGLADLDPRRFKMNIAIDGVEAHAEDGWDGRELAVGECVVRIAGPVPRCVLTTLHPETLVRDADTLRAILAYRTPMAGGEPPFGMYGTVVRPGRIAVGDPVVPV
jgi:uncharacterized protein